MNYSLKDKVIVVTGGANGIGNEIADQYLKQEAKSVIILDLDETQGKKAVQMLTKRYGEGKADFMKCDVTTNLEEVSKLILNKYKAVDVLVLNAGIAFADPRKMIDVFITSVIEWSLKFLESMGKDKGGNGGTFIIMSSIFGFRTLPHGPVYQASKFAVLGFAKSLGHTYNFDKTGVRVLALCPGFTETNLTRPLYEEELKKTFDPDVVRFADSHEWQKVSAVGKAAVDIFEKAASGTAWVIEGDKLTELD